MEPPIRDLAPKSSAALLAALVWTKGASALGPFPGVVPGTEIGGGLSAGFEPSGGAWHPRLGQLFLCGDKGKIARMNRDGTGITSWSLAGNWEGIAVADPANDFTYG